MNDTERSGRPRVGLITLLVAGTLALLFSMLPALAS